MPFDERLKFIILHQTETGRIRYLAPELDSPVSCSFKKFIELLVESNIEIVKNLSLKWN